MSEIVPRVLIGLSLLALIDFPRVAAGESEPAAAQLEQFLTAGFDRRGTSDQALKDEYRELKRASNSDLSPDYAYALALLKRNQYDEAMQILDELRGKPGPAYLPAWQAAIWNRLNRRDYEQGFSQLTELAAMTADPDRKWATPEHPPQNARWMGKLLAGMGYQLTSGRDWENLQAVWHKVESDLTDPLLQQELQAGIQEVRQLRKEIEGDFTETAKETEAEQAKTEEELAKELEQKAEETEKAKEDLKLTAEEWKKKLDKELVEFGRKIGSLERDYAFLDAKRLSLERSITLVQREQTALALAAENAPKNVNSTGVALENGRLNAKLAQYQGEHQQTLVGLQQVTAQGNLLLAQRQALINEYQQATGKLVQQDKKLEQLAKKLSKNQEKLEADDKPVRPTAELRRLRSRMKYLSTYLPFDLDEEKQKLIDSQIPDSGD